MKYLESLEKFGINLGLDRIKMILDELGNPQLKFKSIHVAGTNGKGSTCAMIASILKEAGYKVGLYTSPHLFDYTERIRINGINISKQDFRKGLNAIEKIARKPRSSFAGFRAQPTVFEALTALAFWYFAKEKVDYAVVEVGMGGRLDATNVITPLVSVITNIDLEHTAILGKTLAKIAGEKAGIIKPGVPVVTAESKREPLAVIKRICGARNSCLIAVSGKPCLPAGRQRAVNSGLLGEHQRVNAACAVAAIRLAGIKVSRSAIKRGLEKVRWPGRFQIVARRPLTIVDGAHNPAGVNILVKTLRTKFSGRKFSFIVGVQKDKDSAGMMRLIKPPANEIIVTRSSNTGAAEIVNGIKAIPLKRALALTAGKGRVITGSLFLAADVLRHLDVNA